MSERMAQQIAAAFALCAFSVSIGAGLHAGVPSGTILIRSIVVLLAATAIGRVLGRIASVALHEHLAAMTARNPIPEPVAIPDVAGGTGEVEVIEDVESP